MEKYCINSHATLIECLKNMAITGAGIVLAVDDDLKLIGTVSNGDIRKALIKNYSLDSPISSFINRNCFSVSPTVTRTEVLDIMQARRFDQVPIIDESGKVIGIHLLHDILGNTNRPNWAVVMAGGQGMRMRPVTETIPKPMIKVAGRPILERIVLHLISNGVKRIFLSVNHLREVIEDYFEDGKEFGAKIEYLHEDKPLGSGGSISLLPEIPEDPLLVMNGDLIVEANLSNMLDFHSQNEFYATMGAYSYFYQIPYGCIDTKGKYLIGLQEKPVIDKLINAGIYVLSAQAVTAIPKNKFYPITKLFENAIDEKKKCGVYTIEKEWLDLGTPQQILHARGEV